MSTDPQLARVTGGTPRLADEGDPRYEVRIAPGAVVALHQQVTGYGQPRWIVVLLDDDGCYRSTLAAGRGSTVPTPVLDQALRTADRLYGRPAPEGTTTT